MELKIYKTNALCRKNRYNRAFIAQKAHTMLTAANITVQFGSKPLFENVNAKFSDGNRYGLIGANGAGKSSLMKVLSGQLST